MVKIYSTSAYPRPITDEEREFLLMGLHTLGENKPIPVKGADSRSAINWVYREDLIEQINSLIVIGQCQCGDPMCHTVQFNHYVVGASEKIVEMLLDDGRTLSIYINRDRGLLSGLEVVKE